MKSVHVSSAMIYNFLLDANEDVSQSVTDLLNIAQEERASLHVHPVTVCDCCAMIESTAPEIPKHLIANALTRFIVLDGVRCAEKDVVLNALETYARNNVKFADAWISVLSNVPISQPAPVVMADAE